jgi:hypothetical protein
MRKGEGRLSRLRAAAAIMRAGCIALLVGVSACGGGGDDTAPPSAEPAPAAEPVDTQPAPVTTQPALLVVGTALSIDRQWRERQSGEFARGA